MGLGDGKTEQASRVSEQIFPGRIHSAWTWAPRYHDAEPRPHTCCGTWGSGHVLPPRVLGLSLPQSVFIFIAKCFLICETESS